MLKQNLSEKLFTYTQDPIATIKRRIETKKRIDGKRSSSFVPRAIKVYIHVRGQIKISKESRGNLFATFTGGGK